MKKVRERILSYHNRENVSLFLDITKELIEALDINPEDKRFVCTIRNDNRKRISIDINKRLIGGLKNVGATEHFIFMLYAKDIEALKAKGLEIAGRENSFADIKDSEETLAIDINREQFLLFNEEILEKWQVCCAEYLPRNSSSMYRKHHNADMYRMITDVGFRKNELDSLYENQFSGMDFFNQSDVELIKRHANEKKEPNNSSHKETYAALKATYDKVAYWSDQVTKRVFPKGQSKTIKKPTNQSNNFETYLWSKIFPYPKQTKELAFTVSIEAHLFIIKIDTIGDVPFREEYEAYRGNYSDSPIILKLPADQVLAMDWYSLIRATTSFIEQHMSDYDHILNKIVLKGKTNYWLFQCNPAQYDIVSSLKANVLDSWLVRSHKDSIKEGDKVILWVTGTHAGCYALAEILDKPIVRSESAKDTYWKVDSKEELRAGIKITHNLVNAPVLQSAIDTNPNLKKLKGGNQGTNFSASETEYNEIVKLINMNKTTAPLNQILYGPPGTGKTFKLKNDYIPLFTEQESTQTEEEYLIELIDKFSWWEIIAAALYDLGESNVTDLMQHKLIQTKLSISKNNSARNTVWGQMQTHAALDCPNVKITDRRAPYIFYKNEASTWKIINDVFEEEVPELKQLAADAKIFKPKTVNKLRYVFTTFHQSYGYEDFIEGIKPIVVEDEANPDSGKSVIYDIVPGVFKKIAEDAIKDPSNDYAIFIDEINRGNVSAIFGELITLIEEDKRIGKKQEIKVKLPYSHQDFGVPPNLHIIGTMNTADRSVEALDTALRRRFTFKEVMPQPELLKDILFEGFNLDGLLTIINQRIEVLLDRDHTIGHSYFIKLESGDEVGLNAVFKDSVIPLLQEYFYGDYEKIAWVLGKEFVEYIPKPDIQFPKFKGGNKPETSASFRIINIENDKFDIIKAVKELISPNAQAEVTDGK